ncbi:SDR family NAD(P)-dependent oxidoreductase [Saccharibacillus sp. JS10]|uniref:SDR family NAD(P)-dependent oxidoreductase n=1 Tax=Saccharibacillus sp. JS10 TaxID=2950552 RepID=UPI00210E9E67|nr:glucose 1-dehydrogenase [Saccharibacillus sp. JS10]MCQ4086950.1 glucose 1-dehydrogenase [Saccharibacillus sp. JS10]
MASLTGKVAIVTGGANGIGEACVKELAAAGAKVVFSDLNDELGKKLEQELNAGGAETRYQHSDVSKEEDVKALIQRAMDEFGRLDTMVSNAGIGNTDSTDDLTFESWRKLMSINLDGVFLCAKYAIQEMKKNGEQGGSVINMASMLGHVGRAATSAYTASKGGVVNLTKSLALEYGPQNIRVNAVCPGYVETPLLNSTLDEETQKYLASLHAFGRLAKPEEVGKAVVFLASDDSSFVTGSSLMVDGGYTAQ